MAERILMTALSPTMEEGTIVDWNKSEGDAIAPGDVLCEVETDKATMDYESTQEGVLLKIIKGDGGSALVGQTIGVLGEKGEDIAELLKEIESEAAATPSGAGSTTASAGATSPDGTAEAAQSVAVTPSATTAGSTTGVVDATGGVTAAGGQVKSSPLARKIAEERGINIASVPGSGPGGRVVKKDVESFRPGGGAAGGSGASGSAAFAFAPAQVAGEDVKIPVDRKRAVIASRLSESMYTAPHYYLKATVQMDGALAARAQLNKELPEKVGFNPFLIKYAAEALKRHPVVNASWQGDHILQFGSIDVGLAVDLGNGLITPIVRNCGNKGIVQIDAELKALIQKARDGKLQPDEYTGATFTISNLGSFGVEEFTAIINPPGSAILAVGEIVKTLVPIEDDEIEVARMMKMTLSCDHRVIDGAAGGRFLHDLKAIIQDPIRTLF
jgi:pyruvate dehydrogenase E2 component (dihydrolipoamide acetyltransferase)